LVGETEVSAFAVTMEGRAMRSRRWFREYVFVTVAFWLSVWLVWGGTASDGSSSVHLGLSGAIFNFAMLGLLALGVAWARWVLIAQAVLGAGFIASLGVPPFGPWFGCLALVALFQAFCLWSMRDGLGPAPAVKP
jgi:hypothetical protein